jgi:hypothetical protein
VKFHDAYAAYQDRQSAELRKRVNEAIPAASDAAAGLGLTVTSFNPVTGLTLRRVNLIREALNVDELDSMGASVQKVVDLTERGIAEYNERANKAKWLIANPLVWLWTLIEQVLRMPFLLFSVAGLRTATFEMSPVGQVLKLTEMVLAIALALKRLRWI